MTGMRRVPDDEHELEWLLSLPEADSSTGFEAEGWAADLWVLHAMFENPALYALGTYEDLKQLRLASGAKPFLVGEVNVDAHTIDVGVPSGYVTAPGIPWKRLTWAEYLARSGSSLGDPRKARPGHGWFPPGSWPVAVMPPPEGSMDQASFETLIDVIAAESEGGAETDCFAFFASLPAGDFSSHHLWRGPIRELVWLVGEGRYHYTPTNWWAADRSWFVMTHYDLQGTKISGSEGLIHRLREDEVLETTDWKEQI